MHSDDDNKSDPQRLTALPPRALNFERLQTWGEEASGRLTGLMLAAGAVLVVVFGLGGYWSLTAKIGGAVIATGKVIAEGNNQIVQHLEGGILEKLLVREGDHVQAGTTVAVLGETATKSQLDAAEIDRALRTIELQRWRAESQNQMTFSVAPEKLAPKADHPRVLEALDNQLNEIKAAAEARREQISVLNNRIANENEDIKYQKDLLISVEDQTQLAQAEFDALNDLFKRGLSTRQRVFTMQRELKRLEAQKSNAVSTQQQAKHNILSFNDSKNQLAQEHRERISQNITRVQQELNNIEDVIARLGDRLGRAEIKAPVSGTVLRISLKSIGGVIASGATIMEILPENSALELEVSVPPREIASLFSGQDVDIVFPSDQTRVLPPLKGQVKYISADTILDPAINRSFYIVNVELPKESNGRNILPGNEAEAFFKTRPRTFAQYMAEPVSRFALRSFKE